MLSKFYETVLRLPSFRGKSRLEGALRARLRPRVSRIIHGIAMELDPEEWPQIELLKSGCLEPRTTVLFERLLKPGDVYVDVGAHVGYHALCVRRLVGAEGRVVAIDPQPYNCHKLLINAELNGFSNIMVIPAAAGAEDRFVFLKNQARSDKSRLTLREAGVNDRTARFSAPVVTLDAVQSLLQIKRLDMLKIDVEGFELEVLQGAGAILAETSHIIVEVLPSEELARILQLQDLLQTAGFQLFDVEGAAWQPGRPAIENNVWARRN
jgi:FkbM family methyltransferase